MVETGHPRRGISWQCRMLGLPRSTWYPRPKGENDMNFELMRLIDAQFLETPFIRLAADATAFKKSGHRGRTWPHSALERKMGLTAIYRKPKTSAPPPAHKIYPHLLRGGAD